MNYVFSPAAPVIPMIVNLNTI